MAYFSYSWMGAGRMRLGIVDVCAILNTLLKREAAAVKALGGTERSFDSRWVGRAPRTRRCKSGCLVNRYLVGAAVSCRDARDESGRNVHRRPRSDRGF